MLLSNMADANEDEKEALLLNYTKRDHIHKHTLPITYTDVSNSSESDRERTLILSLDIFRGWCVLWMILVHNQGGVQNANDIAWPFLESEWDGVHMADWAFPSFIFITGTALYLASRPRLLNRDCSWKIWFEVICKWVLLFIVGFFLNMIASKFNFDTVRIMGILQRIGTCYVICASLLLLFPFWLQWIIVAVFFGVYVGIMYGVSVPDFIDSNGNTIECGRAVLSPQCNAAGWIDRILMGSHMLTPTDPEGIFTTLTSTVTMWLGLEFGRLIALHRHQMLIRARVPRHKRPFMFRAEVAWMLIITVLLLSGATLNFWYPWNKNLWSFSFTLFVSGFAASVFGLLYFIIDVWCTCIKEKPIPLWLCKVPSVLGSNSLVVLTGIILVKNVLLHLLQASDGTNPWTYIYENGFVSWIIDRKAASFVFSLPHLVIWWVVAAVLYSKQVFIST